MRSELNGPGIWYELKRRRLCVRDIAVKARVSDGRLSEALRGRYRLSNDEIDRVAEALGVTARSLMLTVDKREPESSPIGSLKRRVGRGR